MNNYAEVELGNKVLGLSYNQKICLIAGRKVYINKKFYKYSKTTSKHLSMFLKSDSKQIENKIKTGEYSLVENIDSLL